ncbi:hypothetical protein RI367_000043 [Sorochytrium milnesiophthora]
MGKRKRGGGVIYDGGGSSSEGGSSSDVEHTARRPKHVAPTFVQSTEGGDHDSDDGSRSDGDSMGPASEDIQDENDDDNSNSNSNLGRARQQEDEDDALDHAALGSQLRTTETAAHSAFMSGDRQQPPLQFGSSKQKPKLFAGLSNASRTASASSATRQTLSGDFGAFEMHTKGIGMKLLMKGGWKPGQGLGRDGSGIVNPVETKLRPKQMGIGHGDFDEKTPQSKKEERRQRQGNDSASDSPRRTDAATTRRRDGWKRSTTQKRRKNLYKTAGDIMREAEASVESGSSSSAAAASVKIMDMTGVQPREVDSVSEVKSTHSLLGDTSARLPHLRHNLRLLVDLAEDDIQQTATQRKRDQARHKALCAQRDRLERLASDEGAAIDRLTRALQIIKDCSRRIKADGNSSEPNLGIFDQALRTLQTDYYHEYVQHHLDRMVIALIAPLVRRIFFDWSPSEDPQRGTSFFAKWKTLLQAPARKVDAHSNIRDLELHSNGQPADATTSPYESLLWNVWLPHIRNWVNNGWDVHQPDTLLAVLDAWSAHLLPPLVYNNVLDQLVLPKLTAAVSAWNPRKNTAPVHMWLLPWLPYLETELDALMPSLRYKLSVSLEEWHPSSLAGVEAVRPWATVWTRSDLNAFLAKHITPKLVSTLQTDFMVNPAAQDLEPLNWVLAWSDVYDADAMARILQAGFMPTWLDVLYQWLTSDDPNYDEITQWFSMWKSFFAPDLASTTALQQCFRFGLDMMNHALSEQPIPPPHMFQSALAAAAAAAATTTTTTGSKAGGKPGFTAPTMTFRDLVESVVEQSGLMLTSTNKLHEQSGKPIWRIGDSKKSAMIYMDSDVVFVREGDDWAPCALEDLASKVA